MSLLALPLDVESDNRLRSVIRLWSRTDKTKQIAVATASRIMPSVATRGVMRPVLVSSGVSPCSLAMLETLAERWPTLNEPSQLAIVDSITSATAKASI